MEAAFSAAEGFEFGGGVKLPCAADLNAVGGCRALEVMEEGFFFYAGVCLPLFVECE